MPDDVDKFLYWLHRGARAGDPESVTDLAHFYEAGQFVEQSWPEAVRWLRRGARDDVVFAAGELAIILDEGRPGLPRDAKEAARWYRRWADNYSDVRPMTRLAAMYEQGDGVRKDAHQSRYWRERAARVEAYATGRDEPAAIAAAVGAIAVLPATFSSNTRQGLLTVP